MMQEYKIRTVGDDLIHKELYKAAFDEKSSSYDFSDMFKNVKRLIDEADLSIINQETIFVNDPEKYSSFPVFGSPVAVGDAICKAGFDVVLHASNHSLDKGLCGINDTLEFWSERHPDISVLGIHKNRKAAEKICIRRVGDMKIALLNYTEKMNYRPMPLGKPYTVDRMRKRDIASVRKQIGKARAVADLVIIFPHWGCEYLYSPIASQRKWALFFAESGADIIIGTHPHVVQTPGQIETSDGREVPCIYSLGNFISCQILPGTYLGGMSDITVGYDGEKAVIKETKILPLVTHTDASYSYFTTYPLEEYTDVLAAENRLFRMCEKRFGTERINCQNLAELFDKIMKGTAMEDAYFKKPSDVTKFNISGVFNAFMGKNMK